MEIISSILPSVVTSWNEYLVINLLHWCAVQGCFPKLRIFPPANPLMEARCHHQNSPYLCVHIQQHQVISAGHHKIHSGIVSMHRLVLGPVEDGVVHWQHGSNWKYLLRTLVPGRGEERRLWCEWRGHKKNKRFGWEETHCSEARIILLSMGSTGSSAILRPS